jgi:uncharacterized protein YqgC (DUF456 family)
VLGLDGATSVLLVLISGLVGLAMIPLGLPGLWVIVLGILGFGWLTDFRTLGVGLVTLVLVLALLGEAVEAWLGYRFAQRYGGSGRAGWGALIGGLLGAIVGVPVPVIGSVIGGFLGAFAGAALFEYSAARHSHGAVKAGWGAVLGRALAAGVKMAVGVVLVVIGVFAALRS